MTGDPPCIRHVAISGASSGIGEALAFHYAKLGCRLAIAGRDYDRLTAVARRSLALGAAEVTTNWFDVQDRQASRDWLVGVDDAAPIDIVIACAGIGGRNALAGPTGEDPAHAADMIAVNTLGVVHVVGPIVQRLAKRGKGRIVFIGSMAGRIGLPHSPAYCASKAAVAIYADGLRRLLKPHGVSVTTIVAGYVDTPMSRSLDMKRPFCVSAEVAAKRIARAVDQGSARCEFPWQLSLCIKAAGLLPAMIVDSVLSRFR